MHCIKLLQIGDIHFPENSTKKLNDSHYDGFPKNIADEISTNQLKSVMRKISKMYEEKNIIDGILFCGDLTTEGSLEGYQTCVEYLKKLFKFSSSKTQIKKFHIVPGNHDIDRNNCNVSEDLYEKFQTLDKIWNENNMPIFSSSPREVEIKKNNCKALILSLNSCIGCGEKRFLPEKISDDLYDLIKKLDLDDEDLSKIVYEDLDTPAFCEEHISKVSDSIAKSDDHTIAVFLSHHNLLPQAIPRLALYSEVINGGMVRKRLVDIHKPILYFHGHIHDDPIEIINLPSNNSMPLISISAPEAIDGFNLINIYYSSKKIPVYLSVIPYRLENHGEVFEQTNKINNVVFYPIKDIEKVCDSLVIEIISIIKYKETICFKDLQDRLLKKIGRKPQKKTLTSSLNEAEWFGVIDIYDKYSDPLYWQIQKVII